MGRGEGGGVMRRRLDGRKEAAGQVSCWRACHSNPPGGGKKGQSSNPSAPGAAYVLDPSYYTLYTPFRAVHTPMYTRYACIYTLNTPLHTPLHPRSRLPARAVSYAGGEMEHIHIDIRIPMVIVGPGEALFNYSHSVCVRVYIFTCVHVYVCTCVLWCI